MSKRKRRHFSPEFKAEAVRLCRVGDRSIGQVAKDLGLTETALREWVKRADEEGTTPPAGALSTVERDELVRLRKQVKRLEMEREILKNHPGLRPTCWTRSSVEVRRRAGSEGAAGHFLATSYP